MRTTSAATHQRGAAALIVVMLLFFILSLVAAYTSRNLIFEQKTSANQYRATQALEAAEAGVEWALAMLNGGRIDAACTASTDPSNTSFRQRYLKMDDPTLPVGAPRGSYGAIPNPSGGTPPVLRAACVADSTSASGWTCSCPSTGNFALSAPTGTGSFPAFTVALATVGDAGPPPSYQPGAVRIESVGCTRLDNACLTSGQGASGDAAATVSVVAALAGALPTQPGAALTVRQLLSPTSTITLRNRDSASNGMTANAGGAASLPTAILDTLPGTPAQFSVVSGDASLSSLTAEQLFATFFRADKARYKYQPAALRVNDCASGCADELHNKWEANPGRVLWVDGDLSIDSTLAIGSPTDPVLIVVTGDVKRIDGMEIYGVIYSQGSWINTGNVTVHGAVIAEDDFQDSSSASTIEYDPAVLERLRLTTGSLVRVPGSWRDF